jgi:hypothetical protein
MQQLVSCGSVQETHRTVRTTPWQFATPVTMHFKLWKKRREPVHSQTIPLSCTVLFLYQPWQTESQRTGPQSRSS